MIDFSNKNVIVTGGASGIGKAVVEGIVAGGGHAIIFDINEKVRDRFKKNLARTRYRYIRST